MSVSVKHLEIRLAFLLYKFRWRVLSIEGELGCDS